MITKQPFVFDTSIRPAALTPENIKKITDGIAALLAQEAKAGIAVGEVGEAFHVRIGGGHSREFSKTSEHKNVIHSEVIVKGGGTWP